MRPRWSPLSAIPLLVALRSKGAAGGGGTLPPATGADWTGRAGLWLPAKVRTAVISSSGGRKVPQGCWEWPGAAREQLVGVKGVYAAYRSQRKAEPSEVLVQKGAQQACRGLHSKPGIASPSSAAAVHRSRHLNDPLTGVGPSLAAMEGHQEQLLFQAAQQAVGDFQARWEAKETHKPCDALGG